MPPASGLGADSLTVLQEETGRRPVRQEKIPKAEIIELICTSFPVPIDISGEFYYSLQGKQDQAHFWEKQIKTRDRTLVHVIVL